MDEEEILDSHVRRLAWHDQMEIVKDSITISRKDF